MEAYYEATKETTVERINHDARMNASPMIDAFIIFFPAVRRESSPPDATISVAPRRKSPVATSPLHCKSTLIMPEMSWGIVVCTPVSITTG